MTNKEKIAQEISFFKGKYGGKKLVAGVDYEIFNSDAKFGKAKKWALDLIGVNSYEEAKQHNLI